MFKVKSVNSVILTLLTVANIFIIFSVSSNYIQSKYYDIFNQEAVQIYNDNDILLSPMGLTVGIKINTEGLIIMGVGPVVDSIGISHSPAQTLQAGDNIIFANNKKLVYKEDLMNIIKNNNEVNLVLKRGEEIINTNLYPIKDKENINKLGVWVRDTAQGIGTITYYNQENGKFGALGHGIMDAQTKHLMDIKDGEVSLTYIEAIKKGKKGDPGELTGYLDKNTVFGKIKSNTPYGIFGYLNDELTSLHTPIPTAYPDEIALGEATILSNIEGPIKSYKINIESINKNTNDSSKSMVVKVVDEHLISKTNGIVQGMSGSPIIQNNKIIGAVTHVFVQEPTKGYGIFIHHMLNQDIRI